MSAAGPPPTGASSRSARPPRLGSRAAGADGNGDERADPTVPPTNRPPPGPAGRGRAGPGRPGLYPNYPRDWRKAAKDNVFQRAQDDERDRVYFNPAVQQGKADGLGVLGQFAYYDAIVMHGNGDDRDSFGSIRKNALKKAKPPA